LQHDVAPMLPQDILWRPKDPSKTNLANYMDWLVLKRGQRFTGYRELYEWSISDLPGFWSSIVEYFDVRFEQPASQVLIGEGPEGAHWFPGATLNYAGYILERLRKRPTEPAILFRTEESENGQSRILTGSEVIEQVARVVSSLKNWGITSGDRVVGFLPNRPETVILFLATACLGAIWSNCPPEFSSKAVLDRFKQIEPKLLFAVSSYRYGGKNFDIRSVLNEIASELPELKRLVIVAGETAFETDKVPVTDLREAGGEELPEELEVAAVPFEHPLWILYSSGTTGIPKAIVHGHGGMLLEHLKLLAFHLDLGPQDRFFWFTTAGWMMWNVNVSGLAVGSCIVLYEGSPKFSDYMVLWQLVDEEKVTYFGTSAPYLLACMKAEITPGKQCLFESLKGIGSTGAPLPAEGFDWVYREVKKDLWLGSMSGGTDVCTAFVLANPLLPVQRGKLQCRALGARIESWNEEGASILNSVGELVMTAPMPCMPVCFWNDPDGSRLHTSYFEHFSGNWRHGDWIEIDAATGQCTIYGRSDATLNRGGVRMGTSEFYRVVEGLPEVEEALVIDTTGIGDASGRLYLFVALKKASTRNLKEYLAKVIRSELSPRYVPDEIFVVREIPHTTNGKKLEIPIKHLFQGKPLSESVSRGAVANPGALEEFEKIQGSLA
jgi:acetoacetyl-CoA synthetase